VQMVILDTAGYQAPILRRKGKLEEEIVKRTATEYFQRDIIFDIADQIIIVVNDLTYNDQIFIINVSQSLSNLGKKKTDLCCS